MPILTERQRKDLHDGVKEYLQAHNFNQTLSAFEAELAASGPVAAMEQGDSALERKWSVNLRLQQKVQDLETQLAALQAENQGLSTGSKTPQLAFGPVGQARITLTGHRSPVLCVKFHPNLPSVITASEDSTLRVWDYETGETERVLRGHTAAVFWLDIDSEGKRVASASGDLSIRLWDLPTGECIRTIRGHDHRVSCVCWMPGGDGLVSCSRDGTVRMWDPRTGFERGVMRGHDGWVRTVTTNPTGTILASGGDDRTVRVWEGTRCRIVLRGAEHTIECIAIRSSPPTASQQALEGSAADSCIIVAGSRDKCIHVWEGSGRVLHVLRGHDDWIHGIALHHSGQLVVSCGDDRSIRTWDVTSGRSRSTIPNAHDHFCTAVVWHPVRPLLATGSVDKTVKIWLCK
eukprot:NODE_1330_length_1582_cov_33.470972_g1194_i0.p1 GENE.NODE_1330_length_1582_cov_33.470972_g1194_i0~~NODE_1330_length_1582_cov_33.470972_g1194_i0.p1  ORF type:complete len:431 (-),score=63.62 NODE_1330_length_1582_cov_33.470972_g1194_i0:288-1499(-)